MPNLNYNSDQINDQIKGNISDFGLKVLKLIKEFSGIKVPEIVVRLQENNMIVNADTIPGGTERKFFYKLRQSLIDNDSDKKHTFTANYLYLLDGNYLPTKIIDLNDLNLDTNLLRKVLNDEIDKPRNTSLWAEILRGREGINNSNTKTSKQRKESVSDVRLDGEESPNKRKRDSSTSSEDLRDDTRKRITTNVFLRRTS